ncbi:MAG: FtsX-like permease family protein [Chloroflexi bacterium]|nr:FtsX-like permease family protein [Chloroflexota bacterium]
MQKLFGVSMTTITIVLLALFVIVMGFIGVLAWRSRIMLKLGLRNIPKRPAQTALIILGLMLSTVIITSAFGTGDTIVYTIRSLAARGLGNTDEVVSAGDLGSPGGSNYFDYSRFDEMRTYLLGYDKVDRLLPAITESAPLIDVTSQKKLSGIAVFAPDAQYMNTFSEMKDTQGQVVTLDDLGENEVYLDDKTAEDLNAKPDHMLYLFLGEQPTVLKLKAAVKGSSSNSLSTLIMPLSMAQEILGKEGQINAIYVSNYGGPVDGAKYSDQVKGKLEYLLEGTGLKVQTVKQDTLKEADTAGSAFTTIFVAIGLFSIAAGVLLILLIFMMLAAARKSEMGMARAVGTKRHHLIEMFIFEGTAYDLGAALVGVVLGVALTFAIAGIMARIFQNTQLDLAFHFEPRSLVVAFTLGMLVTFITVAVASWRVSRLNIVRAIRDIPEPRFEKVGRRGLVLALLVLFIGLMSSLGGVSSGSGTSLYIGISLFIIGLALLLRCFGVKERIAFTLAGIALLVWTLLPIDVLEVLFGDLSMGIEMFFLSGMIMVLGAVWVVTYNLDILLRILTIAASRLRGVVPALRTALAYPMKNRMRTGLTLAMFSLVIFTMIFMSAIITSTTAALKDVESFSGGYDVQGTVTNPIPDIHAAIAAAPGLNADDFKAIAGQSTLPLEIRQVDAKSQEWKPYLVHGVDNTYLNTNTFKFALMAKGYTSPQEIWQDIGDKPNLAVVSSDMVPSRNQFGLGGGGEDFQLEGIYQEDKSIDTAIEVEMQDPYSGQQIKLTVIGVLESVSFNYGVYTSQTTLGLAWPAALVPTTYLFQLNEGVDAKAVADALDTAFLTHGMEATSVKEMLDEGSKAIFAVNSLLQGFMSLGLVVGIAALGVISTRAVVERRHEIGVLRAIGYQRRTVQLSFLLESSLVALLGIFIGVVLGLALSHNVINFMSDQMEGLKFHIPWMQIVIIVGITYVASLLMTLLPAWHASRIYPAEALRYE